jgi:hypothetical protein
MTERQVALFAGRYVAEGVAKDGTEIDDSNDSEMGG